MSQIHVIKLELFFFPLSIGIYDWQLRGYIIQFCQKKRLLQCQFHDNFKSLAKLFTCNDSFHNIQT